MPLSYQHFPELLLLDDEAGPLEEELPRLADEGLNRRVAEDLNLGNLNLDPAFGANSNNPDWDFNPNKNHWPEANQEHQLPARDHAKPARFLLKETLCFPLVAVQNLRTETALVFPSHHLGLSQDSYGSGPQSVSPGSVY
uniref:Truncated polymerase n=1 Tax=Hepatitis B virus TaxID=10407 RepID=B5TZH6_HBV|nr:truncated polymerase [Hepatitis B virus]